jgi:hypothetical protein
MCNFIYLFMLLLRVSASTAIHHQGLQVVITDTSLSDTSLYQYLVVASLTFCSLQMINFVI